MYYEEIDDCAYEKRFGKMDSKKRHPFAVTCRKCGSNNVIVQAVEHCDLVLECEDCGMYVSCGNYCTKSNDYTEWVHGW